MKTQEYSSAYDEATSSRFKWLACICIMLGGLGLVYTHYYVPYSRHYSNLYELQQQSITYLSTQICSDPTVRVTVERVHDCTTHKRRAEQSVRESAILAVMADYSWCAHGVCSIGGINITQKVNTIVSLSTYAIVIALALAVYKFAMTFVDSALSWGQLPLTQKKSV